MISPEDCRILGMAPVTGRRRRSSAVSQALRAVVQTDLLAIPLPERGIAAPFKIRVASTLPLRRRAYALAHRVYQRAGYVSDDGTNLCISPYDAQPQTLTLLAQDASGNDWATLSLVFDSECGLPCDEIYAGEVRSLRDSGCRIAEVTRLAIDENCSASREVLLQLFNQCYIFARKVRGCSDLVVEVNPRHETYYQRMLHFTRVGPERPCARVQGAPALLLRLNLAEIELTLKESGGNGRDAEGRRVHAYPYSKSEERAVAEALARNHRPMSRKEIYYFGLQSRSAVC